ncbi:hypothetical protein CHARACLAT_001205 [Characodon lateralis]|uniref:Uncharacterized protein n=1 Tax=Characodon lateralis TaxID=208331 RepID=A0ABU7D369_9TELE|nr:hypothetical protein [Characodon lateralis]
MQHAVDSLKPGKCWPCTALQQASYLTSILQPAWTDCNALFGSTDSANGFIGAIKGPPHHGNLCHGNKPLKGMTPSRTSVFVSLCNKRIQAFFSVHFDLVISPNSSD